MMFIKEFLVDSVVLMSLKEEKKIENVPLSKQTIDLFSLALDKNCNVCESSYSSLQVGKQKSVRLASAPVVIY